jgi:2-phospho-L-lactate/phosphoenolpyruvate guanylyltransferase
MAVANIWAVIPVKETSEAKRRLAPGVPSHLRQKLALAMLEDVLAAVSGAWGIAGIAVVTVDLSAATLARAYGAKILTEGARSDHTGAVTAAALQLGGESVGGMMQLPGDIPLATADEFSLVLRTHRDAPSFTIVPSHDEFGSNTVVVSPPTAVPLRFGNDSFFPHQRTAKAHGIEPDIVRLPGIGRDIDTPEDLRFFATIRSSTRTQAFLDRHCFADWPCNLIDLTQAKAAT